ncbi:MAG: putative DCC family thiol-disulfide oxidoreductase YuxK [Cyclobacteriaceae bacterium]|jgi:predicted DCC family thiol-disulfide oxidoreductase YuxK
MGSDFKVENKEIIFFDGICNLCNGAVDLILKKDQAKIFYFSSLQSDFANKFLSQYGYNNEDLDTILYFSKGAVYSKSTAVLKIASHLSFYRNFYFLRIIPAPLRDFFYVLIANSRYSIFGKKNTCRLPTQEERERFLDS